MQNVMINKVELNIRVHVYNKTNADITIEQLVAGLDEKNSNEVKVLDEYTKWFKSPDDVGMAGKSKVEEYLGDLRSIMQNYANEHPEISVTNIEVGNYIKTLGLNGNIIYENNNKVFMLNVMVNKVVLNIRVHVYKFSKGDGDDVKRNKSK